MIVGSKKERHHRVEEKISFSEKRHKNFKLDLNDE